MRDGVQERRESLVSARCRVSSAVPEGVFLIKPPLQCVHPGVPSQDEGGLFSLCGGGVDSAKDVSLYSVLDEGSNVVEESF